MNRELLHKLIDAIVEEVVRRVAIMERRKQNPERVLVLLAAPLAYPKELKELLKSQFGEGYTPISITQDSALEDESTLFLSELGESGLTEKITAAKTVVLVGPKLELLNKIARGEDQDLLSYLMIRSILWKKDVRLYLDFDPPQFKRNTFLEGVASGIETLRQMQVTVCPYYKGDAAAAKQNSLITEADVLAAAERKDKTIHARVGTIITPAARDALLTSGVIVQYEGETICN